jgi:hypothetical protein
MDVAAQSWGRPTRVARQQPHLDPANAVLGSSGSSLGDFGPGDFGFGTFSFPPAGPVVGGGMGSRTGGGM